MMMLAISVLPGATADHTTRLDYRAADGVTEGSYEYCAIRTLDTCLVGSEDEMYMDVAYTGARGTACARDELSNGWRSTALTFAGTFQFNDPLEGTKTLEVEGSMSNHEVFAYYPSMRKSGSVSFTVNGEPYLGTWSVGGEATDNTQAPATGTSTGVGDLSFSVEGTFAGNIITDVLGGRSALVPSSFSFSGSTGELGAAFTHWYVAPESCEETGV